MEKLPACPTPNGTGEATEMRVEGERSWYPELARLNKPRLLSDLPRRASVAEV
jgi:hypothetical protein